LFSFIAIPLNHLLIFNLIYFIEIIIVTLFLHFIAFSINLKRSIWLAVFVFFIIIITGFVIQNV
jgi:hypothetical protein